MRNKDVVRPLEVDSEEVGHEVDKVVHVVVQRVEQVGRPLEVMSEQGEVALDVLITVVTESFENKTHEYDASGSMRSIK